MKDNKNIIHDRKAHNLMMSPRKYLDLGELILTTDEANCFFNDKIIGQPDDLIFDPSSGIIYSIEYKLTSGKRHHAINQLLTRQNHLQQVFPDWYIKNLYIHDNYKIEEIR